MKRALTLIFLTVACIVCFLSIRGTLPFMPIFGSSMEPTLQSGGLLMIKPIDAKDVKVGDIIVYNVPRMVRDFYNYPPTVAHRVVEIRDKPSLGFRTAGDNTGEDPFTVRPQDLRGAVGNQIPFIGLPLLFFQSTQGTIFAIVALALLAFFLYGGELNQGGRTLHRGIFSPVITEEKRTNRILTRKIEATEEKMNSTERALEKFASAIELYAQHLSSHTSAIQGLSEASHELKNGAAEQNRVLAHLLDNIEKPKAGKEELILRPEPTAYKPEEAIPEAEKPPAELEEPAPEVAKKQFPIGCIKNRPRLLTADEVLNKLRKPLA